MEEVNHDREEHGKPPIKDEPPTPKEKEVAVSTTDPESGLFHKGEHKLQFAYEAHTACDGSNFVLGVEATPGNVHDSVAFHPLYDRLKADYPQMETVVADSAYKTPYICKRVFSDGRVLSTAYKRPMTMKGGHEWYKYVYDEYYDCVICPEYGILCYATTNRDGYREYKTGCRKTARFSDKMQVLCIGAALEFSIRPSASGQQGGFAESLIRQNQSRSDLPCLWQGNLAGLENLWFSNLKDARSNLQATKKQPRLKFLRNFKSLRD